MKEYILLIDTTDAKGLVYNVSKILFANNLNIEQNSEFVDEETKKFFMRTVISGVVNRDLLHKELTEALPKDSTIKLTTKQKKDIVLLATKES
ncbi:MAG: formyltetrahydrofolate deformylase, partial [Arcobacteraceae bacterium]